MKKRKPCPSEHEGHKCCGSEGHDPRHWTVVQIDGKIVWVRWD